MELNYDIFKNYLKGCDIELIKKEHQGCNYFQLDKENNKINCFINKTDNKPLLVLNFDKMQPLHRALKFWDTCGKYKTTIVFSNVYYKNETWAKVNVLYSKIENAEKLLNEILENNYPTEMLAEHLKWIITNGNHVLLMNKNYAIAMAKLVKEFNLPVNGVVLRNFKDEKVL